MAVLGTEAFVPPGAPASYRRAGRGREIVVRRRGGRACCRGPRRRPDRRAWRRRAHCRRARSWRNDRPPATRARRWWRRPCRCGHRRRGPHRLGLGGAVVAARCAGRGRWRRRAPSREPARGWWHRPERLGRQAWSDERRQRPRTPPLSPLTAALPNQASATRVSSGKPRSASYAWIASVALQALEHLPR